MTIEKTYALKNGKNLVPFSHACICWIPIIFLIVQKDKILVTYSAALIYPDSVNFSI